jgi:pyridoxine 5-phosphate synthase
MPIRLGVNVDHVASLRNARGVSYPDPVDAALVAERAGAHQITIHLREDRRHINDRDLALMRQTVKTRLNLEMAATQEMMKLTFEHKPDASTLVPERREELTTEGGLDVAMHRDTLKRFVRQLREADIWVSVFIEPDLDQIKAAHKVDANAVELHTGKFADAPTRLDQREELARLADAAKAAQRLGMAVCAGHGLHYHNVTQIAAIEEIEELNIGHAIISRAVVDGLDRSVRDMLALMQQARGWPSRSR